MVKLLRGDARSVKFKLSRLIAVGFLGNLREFWRAILRSVPA